MRNNSLPDWGYQFISATPTILRAQSLLPCWRSRPDSLCFEHVMIGVHWNGGETRKPCWRLGKPSHWRSWLQWLLHRKTYREKEEEKHSKTTPQWVEIVKLLMLMIISAYWRSFLVRPRKEKFSFSGFFSQKMMRAGGFFFYFLGAWPTLNHAHIRPTSLVEEFASLS